MPSDVIMGMNGLLNIPKLSSLMAEITALYTAALAAP